jgi:hypothetical protein
MFQQWHSYSASNCRMWTKSPPCRVLINSGRGLGSTKNLFAYAVTRSSPAVISRCRRSNLRQRWSAVQTLLASVSEMIQSFSTPTVDRGFLSNGNRARAGARMVTRFSKTRKEDYRRGYHDGAVPLAAWHAAGPKYWIRHPRNPEHVTYANCSNVIFRAGRRNRPFARLHQENQKDSKRRQSFGSATQKCLYQKQLNVKTNTAAAASKVS